MNIKRKVTALLLVVAATAVPAGADHGYGTITGTVTDGVGAPLSDVCVQAYAYDEWDEWYYEVGATVTGFDGIYTLEVPTYYSTVRIEFGDWCEYSEEEPQFLAEWYDNESSFWSADEVGVVDDTTTSGIDAVLEEAGSISGTVTTVDGDLGCLQVQAYALDGGEEGYAYSENGEYSISGLRPGSYAVQFRSCWDYWEDAEGTVSYHDSIYAAEWYDDKISFSSATPVSVLSGIDTPNIDAELERGGSITGTVSVPDIIEPEDASVSVYSPEGDYIRDGYVNAAGEFTVGPLKAGSYRVHFGGQFIQGEWFDDKPSISTADPVEVLDQEETSGIDASLLVRPAPDFAVQGLRIKKVPVRTDYGQVGYTGWTRKIEVDVANIGERFAEGYLDLTAYTTTDYRASCYGSEWLELKAGQARTLTFDWIALGSVGDVVVEARAEADDDRNWRNNVMRDSHYVIAGGLGVGVTAQRVTNCEQ